MRKVGKLVVMLSLVAIAPSFAGKNTRATEAKKTAMVKKTGDARQVADVQKASKPVDASLFKGLENRIVFVNNEVCEKNGDGSFLHPFTTLEDAQKGSKAGQIIYVKATGKRYKATQSEYYYDEYYDLIPAVIHLKPSQSLVSSGCALKIGDKTIPATTPGEFAEIFIDGEYAQSGVIMTNCNQVAGFIFEGVEVSTQFESLTGIGSFSDLFVAESPSSNVVARVAQGIGGKSSISRNLFKKLENGIDLKMQPWSSVDIFSNRFLDVAEPVQLVTRDGDTVHIQDNSFEGIMDECIQSFGVSTFLDEGKKRSKAKHKAPFAARMIGDEEFDSSDAAELYIRGNTFKGTANFAIDTSNTKKVEICDNHASGHIRNGLSVDQFSPIESTVRITGNTFEIEREHLHLGEPPNILSLQNVQAEVKNNQFVHGSVGLFVDSSGGVVACVEGNSFKNYTDFGFEMTVEPDATVPSCLRLLKNHAKPEATAFEFCNNTTVKELFQVEGKDKASVEKLNFGGKITVQQGEVHFVPHCPKCHESK